MGYLNPKRFVSYVADRARCSIAGDAEIDAALDWLREEIIAERKRLDAYYERIEARQMSGEDE